MKKIGPSFFYELSASGLAGLPFSWNANGVIIYGAAADGTPMTTEQIARVEAVYAAHDPAAPAPQAVPEVVTKYQAVAVLARHGLLAQVNAFFGAMGATDERRLAWDMSPSVRRDSASTLAAIDALALTAPQADALFIEAAQVE